MDSSVFNFGLAQNIEKIIVFSEDKHIKYQYGNALIKLEYNSKLSNNYLN